MNLISNSLKFTFEGSIEIIVKEDFKTENNFIIAVRDTGIGIKEEDNKKLFSKFTRINYGDKLTINSTGTGLGLLISNELVKLLCNNKN